MQNNATKSKSEIRRIASNLLPKQNSQMQRQIDTNEQRDRYNHCEDENIQPLQERRQQFDNQNYNIKSIKQNGNEILFKMINQLQDMTKMVVQKVNSLEKSVEDQRESQAQKEEKLHDKLNHISNQIAKLSEQQLEFESNISKLKESFDKIQSISSFPIQNGPSMEVQDSQMIRNPVDKCQQQTIQNEQKQSIKNFIDKMPVFDPLSSKSMPILVESLDETQKKMSKNQIDSVGNLNTLSIYLQHDSSNSNNKQYQVKMNKLENLDFFLKVSLSLEGQKEIESKSNGYMVELADKYQIFIPEHPSSKIDIKIQEILNQEDLDMFFPGLIEIQDVIMPFQCLWLYTKSEKTLQGVKLHFKTEKEIQKEVERNDEEIKAKMKQLQSQKLICIDDCFLTESSFKLYSFIEDQQCMVHSFNDQTKLFKIVSRNSKASYFIPITMPCLNGIMYTPQNQQKLLIVLTDRVVDQFISGDSCKDDAKAIEIISQTFCNPNVQTLEDFMKNLAQCYKEKMIDLFSVETSDPFISSCQDSASNYLFTDAYSKPTQHQCFLLKELQQGEELDGLLTGKFQ